MSIRADLLAQGATHAGQRPWPRLVVDRDAWRSLSLALARGEATLLGLWSDGSQVHLALHEDGVGEITVASLACPDGRFPSVARAHAPAQRPERAMVDLYGLQPEDAPDTRPWLDHNRWGLRHPLGAAAPVAPEGAPYAFLAAEGPPLHQIPVGPVHAGTIEPGHFRFSANGETVVRLEERLGYVHKGIEGLLVGAAMPKAARIGARISGDSTVAYAIAFARAVEAAVGVEVPPRAHALRAIMAELERIGHHLGDVGAICNDAAFALMLAHCGALRERVLRCADACFGHRMMMDRVVPGGAAVDLDAEGARRLTALIADSRAHFPELVALYDRVVSLQDRTVTTGITAPELVRRFGAGGIVGRACGRAFDARRTPGYAPYTGLSFEIPVRAAGDVDARVWVRIDEVNQSLSLIEQLVAQLPGGATRVELPTPETHGEGIALVEAFRGDVLAWVRVAADGSIAHAHFRDASVFQWPLLEAAIEGNIVADFPLINKSFNCSYSGHDG